MTPHEPHDDSVAQYVAGTMPDDELETFEQHLLGCEACRNAVRTGAAARAALGRQPARVARAGAGRRLPVYWAGLAAAAAILLVWTTRDDTSLDFLGDITPAPFVAGALRPSGDSVTALVDSGMAAYAANDFSAAAERLGRAAQADSSASVTFFLGVSWLMRRNNEAALRALERVAAGSPYAGEVAYYAAKALVRLREPDSALAVLDRAASTEPGSELLTAFADSLRRR